jgi:hypothetical protein
MEGIPGRIRANAEGLSDRRDGERVDEWLQVVYAERSMDWDFPGRRRRMVHPGHLVALGDGGRLKGSGLEDTHLGCGQHCGTAGRFEE